MIGSRRYRKTTSIAAALLALLTGCGATSVKSDDAASTTAVAPSTPGPPDHVVVVLFENKSFGSVMGSPDAPFLNSLAADGMSFTDAHAITHPSEPNYIALFAGSTLGVTDDSCPLTLDAPNLASQLSEAGLSFVGYSEDLPEAGYTGCDAGNYTRQLNPWVNFPALPASVNQPLSALPSDYADLPTVSFIVPNLCNNMHSCPVATGDAWARRVLGPYVRWAQKHNSLLLVTFDEDEWTEANRIPTFAVGPMVGVGTSNVRIDLYSILRTIEDLYGLAPLGEAANATPLNGF